MILINYWVDFCHLMAAEIWVLLRLQIVPPQLPLKPWGMAKRKIQLLALLLTGSIPALAHGGHGHFEGHSPMHYLFSTEHVIPIAIVIVVGVCLYQFWWKPLRKGTDK